MWQALDKLDTWMFEDGYKFVYCCVGIGFFGLIWLLGYYCGISEKRKCGFKGGENG